ncbi:Fur family transcriptional regulator [Companilactobacillus jidongensis]|uniref:Fur family transcriptional regulator n=1 Tax=Companilactobacillus jidongensis TaxID=2486006 RepID=UPI000F774B0B|nr:Fur family transcriptional regulator [Companilactobacillus jidongensis]
MEEAIKILRDNHYKVTKQRMDLIEFLSNYTNKYIQISDVDEYMKSIYPGISNNTVYRNLKEFSDIGLVEYQEKNKAMIKFQCDFDQMHHHHFICSNCGKVIELKACPLSFFTDQLPGCEVESHAIEIYGLCPECAAKK